MLQNDSRIASTETGIPPQMEGRPSHTWHRDARDVIGRIERIPAAAARDILSVIVASTDDPLLRFKCLDVMHCLRASANDDEDVARHAPAAIARLREYCEGTLAGSGTT